MTTKKTLRLSAMAYKSKKTKKQKEGHRLEVQVASAFKNPLEEEGLLCRILVSLPLLNLLQVRSVCNFWNSLISLQSHNMLCESWSTRHDGRGAPPWIVMVRHKGIDRKDRELVAFDSASRTWIPFWTFLSTRCPDAALAPLGGPSLPLVVHCRLDYSLGDLKATGSDNGIGVISFLCRDPQGDDKSFRLLLINPVTGTHIILPPSLKLTDVLAHGSYVKINLEALPHHHYLVFLTSAVTHDFPGDMEIYDSRSRSWRAGRSCCCFADAKIGGRKELEYANFLYFSRHNSHVFAYNAELDEWSQLYGKLCYLNSLQFWFPNGVILFRHRGRVLLAAVQTPDICSESLAGFAVWELHPRTNIPPHATCGDEVADWVEVARTPPHLWRGFYEPDKIRYNWIKEKLIFCGGLICMTANYGTHFYVPLVYDLDREEWYHLPPYKGRDNVAAVFAMTPSLAAAVPE